MNHVQIFTDSTCDLPQNILDAYDISIVPLYVVFDDATYKDGIDITPEALYKKVEALDTLPKTSAPSPKDFSDAFKPYIDRGDDILYIGLSSELSSTIQNARLAANEFPEGRVSVIDSLNLSTGIGLLVMKAAEYAKAGMAIEDISTKISHLVPKTRTSFIIDTLDYLYKGGRCSATQNLIGGFLKIKPIVKVVDGTLILGQKARGKKRKAVKILLDQLLKNEDTIDKERIIIGHSMGAEDAQYLKEQIETHLDVKEVIMINAGCVISSHCGPNTLGLYYLEKAK